MDFKKTQFRISEPLEEVENAMRNSFKFFKNGTDDELISSIVTALEVRGPNHPIEAFSSMIYGALSYEIWRRGIDDLAMDAVLSTLHASMRPTV